MRLRVAIAILVMTLPGCGRALGPERSETASVQGRVHLRETPIALGWVEFVPIEGTIGRLRSAKLRADGTFAATEIPVGRVAIRLAGPPLPRTGEPGIDNFLFMCRRQPLIHKSIPRSGIGDMEINLRDEAIAFERAYGPNR